VQGRRQDSKLWALRVNKRLNSVKSDNSKRLLGRHYNRLDKALVDS
jgi:hypothetical protein